MSSELTPEPLMAKPKPDLMSLYFTNQPTSSYIFVISGFCDQVLSSIERLNLESMVFEEMTSKINVPRTKFAAVEINNSKCFAVIGGKNKNSERLSSIEIYDCESDTWVITDNL